VYKCAQAAASLFLVAAALSGSACVLLELAIAEGTAKSPAYAARPRPAALGF